MIINQKSLLEAAPIKGMADSKCKLNGVSHGLAEAGYDIRLKQGIIFEPHSFWDGPRVTRIDETYRENANGLSQLVRETSDYKSRFVLASAVEEFEMPDDLLGVVHDKSTWARHGISVFNTVIEPGWKGFLTLEIVFHGEEYIHLLPGTGIAQVLFHQVKHPNPYSGKYQNQANRPVEPVLA